MQASERARRDLVLLGRVTVKRSQTLRSCQAQWRAGGFLNRIAGSAVTYRHGQADQRNGRSGVGRRLLVRRLETPADARLRCRGGAHRAGRNRWRGLGGDSGPWRDRRNLGQRFTGRNRRNCDEWSSRRWTWRCGHGKRRTRRRCRWQRRDLGLFRWPRRRWRRRGLRRLWRVRSAMLRGNDVRQPRLDLRKHKRRGTTNLSPVRRNGWAVLPRTSL